MTDPFVSIIMRSYNEAWALQGTLPALQAQDYKNWELIVFDSGSITVLGSTPSLFTINRSSSVGFSIAFDPNSNQVIAIDNIRFEAVSAVPEPATWALLAVELGLMAWTTRRRWRRPGQATTK